MRTKTSTNLYKRLSTDIKLLVLEHSGYFPIRSKFVEKTTTVKSETKFWFNMWNTEGFFSQILDFLTQQASINNNFHTI